MNHPLAPKFKIGETVEIKSEPGYTGKVVIIICYDRRYGLDCTPGAVGGYEWMYLQNETGKPHLYAINWFDETDLRKPRKRKRD